jgi:hypothetical protein
LEQYKVQYTKMSNKYQGKNYPIILILHLDVKTEVQKYQEMLESREALISATGFALDHVIEQAKLELGALYAAAQALPSDGSNLQT